VGAHPDWYDGGGGPVATAGSGVAGSVGLGSAGAIFTWTAHPFDWNAPDFQGVNFQADFQTDGSSHFDDDRIGWMITDSSTSSSNIFGLQLDPGGSGYDIEGYWDGASADRRPHIVDLPALSANTWYRFRADITKLTATSASIDVTLTELDASGNPVGVVASGSIADTSTLGADAPNSKYFTASAIWPAYKNYTAAAAPADNACYELVTGAPPQYTLTMNLVGNGSVTLDPAGGTYDEGTVVQLTAIPDSGWEFSEWSGDLTGSTNPDNITMDADKTITATFTALPVLAAGDVIISGVQAWNDPTGQSPGEFIELFNTTDQTISLENMQLTTRVDNDSDGVVEDEWQLSTDLTGKSIAPHSFFLIAESGVAAPGGVHDIETGMDLATGEGGSTERAIGIELVINSVHMDYVLYGRHNGSSPAGEIPDGDIAFDGSSWPRTEVIRNTQGSASFYEGLLRRESAADLYAGYDVAGFYTDEDVLGDGYPNGVWSSPHDRYYGTYEARNSQSPAIAVTFAALGDYGSDNSNEQAVANLVASWNPDLIITTGDNSYGSTPIDDNIGQYYSQYIGNYTGSYGAGSLINRFFPSIGNHDYSDGGGITAYLNYFTLPGNERYYDFVIGPVHFFAINSDGNEPDGNSSTSTQALWLQAQLAASTAPWKIVYMHHPPYSSSSSHGSSAWMQWPYEDWGATAVFSGHDHVYERILRDDNSDLVDIAYFTTGAGGRSLYGFGTPVAGSQVRYNADYGSMLVEASATSITFEFWSIAGGGTQIDTYTITAP
jgi:hypothetical protein